MCTGGWCSGGCAHKGGVDRTGLDEEVSSLAPLANLMRGHVQVNRSRPFQVLQGGGFEIPTLGKVFLPRPAYSLSGEAGAAVHQQMRTLREAIGGCSPPPGWPGERLCHCLPAPVVPHMHRCRSRRYTGGPETAHVWGKMDLSPPVILSRRYVRFSFKELKKILQGNTTKARHLKRPQQAVASTLQSGPGNLACGLSWSTTPAMVVCNQKCCFFFLALWFCCFAANQSLNIPREGKLFNYA